LSLYISPTLECLDDDDSDDRDDDDDENDDDDDDNDDRDDDDNDDDDVYSYILQSRRFKICIIRFHKDRPEKYKY
jgi:hypothetical protein